MPKRKSSDLPTRVYKFGAGTPVINGDIVDREIRLGRTYYNKLIELEHEVYAERRALEHTIPEIAALQDREVDVDTRIRNLIRLVKDPKNGGDDPDPDDCAELRALREEEVAVRKGLCEVKRRYSAHLTPQYNAIDVRHHARLLELRAQSGIRQGTYYRVENSVKQAAKDAYKATGKPPAFKRYDGSGYAGQQFIADSKTQKRRKTDPELAQLRAMCDQYRVEFQDARDMLGRRSNAYPILNAQVKQLQKRSETAQTEFERRARDVAGPNGMTVQRMFSGQDTRLQIDPPPDRWYELPRSDRRRASRTRARLRVDSTDDRKPVFVEFPVTLHRPLPDNAVIKWAHLIRKKIGRRDSWELQLTLESEVFRSRSNHGRGAVAIDIGWRGGELVAYATDEFGYSVQICTPERFRGSLDKVDEIRSERDKLFNDEVAALLNWIADNEVPDWLITDLTHARQWRTQRRLIRLITDWGNRRFTGDAFVFERLLVWRRKDRELWDWEANQRHKTIECRRERYRVIAKRLCTTYSTIVIEDPKVMKLCKFTRRLRPEDGDPSEGRQYRKNMKSAAPGEFREILTRMADKYGARLIDVDPAYSSRRCSWCGCADTWQDSAEREHRCMSCRRTFNRDLNACRNLLNKAGFQPKDIEPSDYQVLVLPNDSSKQRGSRLRRRSRPSVMADRLRCSKTAA